MAGEGSGEADEPLLHGELPGDLAHLDAVNERGAASDGGSDVHGFDGSTGRRRPPIIMGHEASGVPALRALALWMSMQ